jgi:hypothetical protein
MMAKLNEIRYIDERLPDGKQQYLVTGGGKIVCLSDVSVCETNRGT